MMLKISLNSCCKLLKYGLSFIGFGSIIGLSFLMTGCGEDSLDSELLGNFTLDVPIAYVKRPIETLANPRNATNYQPGGNLWIREYASATAPEKNVTAQYTRGCDNTDPNQIIEGDVSDPAVSYDGKRIIFAMILGNYHPDDATNCTDEEYTWSLFEYTIATEQLIAVVNSNIPIQATSTFPKNLGREEGNDIDPAYLPDGRIVFSSDRQIVRGPRTLQNYGFAVDKNIPLLDEGGRNQREATMNLHVMVIGGGKNSIAQITFNQSHDLNPSVLQNGKIIYSRWEHANRGDGASNFDIYQINPDGTENGLLYGAHSHDTADGSESVFLHPRQIPGSPARIISTLMPRQDTFEGGELVYIDYENFAEINIPKITSSSANANGQTSATGGRVPLAAGNSSNGRYTTPYPLWDNTNRALVAWAPCKVIQNGSPQFCTLAKDMTLEPAPAEYGIWILDLDANAQRQMVFPDPGFTITDPVAIIDRDEALSTPAIISDKTAPAELDQDLFDAGRGKLVIKSVYDTDNFGILNMGTRFNNEAAITCTNGPSTPNSTCSVAGQSPDINAIKQLPAEQRLARFLRVVKPVPIVDNENATNMREILGYVPIEPDGSVVVEVPADRPLALEILGVNGKLIQKFQIHNSWIQVKPGETKVCNGCHSSRNGQPALNQGASGSELSGGFVGAVLASAQQDPTPGNTGDNNAGGFTILPDLIPSAGDTMAETLERVSCANDGCSSRKLNADIEFHDVWRDPNYFVEADPNLHFAYRFQLLNINANFSGVSSLNVPVQPEGADPTDINTFSSCAPSWDVNCKIAYNYEKHIHPIWEKPRMLVDPNNANAPILDSGGMNQVNYTCTLCHNTVDSSVIPAGQLDLTKDGPTEDMTQYTSYRELRFEDNAQELDAADNFVDNTLRPQFNGQIDPNTGLNAVENLPVPLPFPPELVLPGVVGFENLILPQTDPLFPYINVDDRSVRPNNNSRIDGRFLDKMTQVPSVPCDPTMVCYPGTANHNEMLNEVELRLIGEWIDTGGLYFSDPVDAPAN